MIRSIRLLASGALRAAVRAPGVAALVLTAAFAAAAYASAPTPALSTTPGVGNWTVPALIPVVGHDALGQPDPRGEIVIIVRDFTNTPIPNSVVSIDFSGCPDVRLCANPNDPAAVVNCALSTVSKITNVNGEVRFRVVGGSVTPPGQPGAPWNCARIYADGVLGASPTVAIYDLEGFNGLDPSDLAAWLKDFFNAPSSRGDYNGDGNQSPSDLSLWLNVYFADGSILNCAGGGRCGP